MAAGVESVLEFRYVRGVERPHGLPEARRQQVAILGGRRRRTDNDYVPFGVVVELDGRLGHEGEAVFRDRTRDNSTTVSGKATLRFGWADVDARACEVAEDVAEAAVVPWVARGAQALWASLSGVDGNILKDRGCSDGHDPSQSVRAGPGSPHPDSGSSGTRG